MITHWRLVSREIHAGRQTTRDIADSTGLDRWSVGVAARLLESRGRVERFGKLITGRGRPWTLWRAKRGDR